MDERDAAGPDERGRRAPFMSPIGIAATIVGIMLAVELLRGFNGGGPISVISGLSAARANAPAIDIDNAGLRLPAFVIVCLAVAGLLRLAPVDLAKRSSQIMVMIAMIGGGLVLDGIYGESVITQVMAGQGYSRCSAHDHRAGMGKNRVWFDDFVLNRADCPGIGRSG